MNRENVFRLKEYVNSFEKALNYIIASILAVVTAVLYYTSQKGNGLENILLFIKNSIISPEIIFEVGLAVFSSLPYFCYYTLKNNTHWNYCNDNKDNIALLKTADLYEIFILTLFYLLIQGENNYIVARIVIAGIIIGLLLVYLALKTIEKKKTENIYIYGYFILIIVLGIVLFTFLFYSNLNNYQVKYKKQDLSTLVLILCFILNTLINVICLWKSESTTQKGIVSNRIKIISPVVFIAAFTVIIIYCFYEYNSNNSLLIGITVYFIIYEILLFFLNRLKRRSRWLFGTLISLLFIFIPPAILFRLFGNSQIETILDWFVLVGICMYMSAFKYWGSIFQLQILEDKKSKVQETTNMIFAFHNAILESIVFLSLFLLISGKYRLLLLSILICSMIAIIYAHYYVLEEKRIKGKRSNYNNGKIIELIALISPIIFFGIDRIWNIYIFPVSQKTISIHKPRYIIVLILMFCIDNIHTNYIWNKDKNNKVSLLKEVLSKIQNVFSQKDKTLFLDNVGGLIEQVSATLKDSNIYNFFLLYTIQVIYFAGAFLLLKIFRPSFQFTIDEIFYMALIVLDVIIEYFFIIIPLKKYYLKRMKEMSKIEEFRATFEKEWEKCLDKLAPIAQRYAEQFVVGNRLRPILFFLGSSCGQYKNLEDENLINIVKAACSLELIHKASVMFDDWIDNDSKRNGRDVYLKQYPDVNTMVLLGCAMLGEAQVNFAECRKSFKCNEVDTIQNMSILADIIVKMCIGCYKELILSDYSNQTIESINSITREETVLLIKNSMELGYRCFHKDLSTNQIDEINALGEKFGFIFQWLNDIEPFSQKEAYIEHKGNLENFDYGKKNIAILTLYEKCSNEEKKIFKKNPSYEDIEELYKKYGVESDILERVNVAVDEMNEILSKPSICAGNLEWVNAFKGLFNHAVEIKNWENKVHKLES